MDANNRSRKVAKDLALKMGWKQEGSGNFFTTKDGDLVNITLSTKGKVESRQFRKDCKYLVSFNESANTLSVYQQKDLVLKGVTRINAKGVHFYQATLK